MNFLITIFYVLILASCNGQAPAVINASNTQIICGAERLDQLIPLLKEKRVALLVNQTAMVGSTHLVDTLITYGIEIKKIFAPEHGFRGDADAGEHVNNGIDAKTGIKIISMYGSKKKPSGQDLKDVDILVFDIQDVGARFYTFISSLHYLMESCAENGKQLLVLDRPNPNGWYVDGPVLKSEFQSFVGVDPIPLVHGLTVGEYSRMVNGEKWLTNGEQCNLEVIECLNYNHNMRYKLPIKPSPNLPNEIAVYNYPSICFFEGTDISVGRGTDYPFQMIGSPLISVRNFSFRPVSKPGAQSPPHIDQICFGYDLRRANTSKPGIDLSYLIKTYSAHSDTSKYFLKSLFFDKLAGTDELRKQLIEGKSEEEIKESWKKDLITFKQKRKKYLLYKDFEQ